MARSIIASAAALVSGVIRRLSGVGLGRTAAALSFTTLLGLVPVFTVAFSYVASYPLFERGLGALEQFLVRNLFPGGGALIRPYLNEFTAKTGELKGAAFALVVVTAVLLVMTVEREINAIWGMREPRSRLRRIVTIALGITLGPLAVGAAIQWTGWLLEASLEAAPFTRPALAWLAGPVAVGLAMLFFALVYAILPARRVPWRSALAGGLVAALAFEAAKRGFIFYVATMPAYERVYGALAMLPLFMIWIFLSWTIVLFGAAVTATLAEGPPRRYARSARQAAG